MLLAAGVRRSLRAADRWSSGPRRIPTPRSRAPARLADERHGRSSRSRLPRRRGGESGGRRRGAPARRPQPAGAEHVPRRRSRASSSVVEFDGRPALVMTAVQRDADEHLLPPAGAIPRARAGWQRTSPPSRPGSPSSSATTGGRAAPARHGRGRGRLACGSLPRRRATRRRPGPARRDPRQASSGHRFRARPSTEISGSGTCSSTDGRVSGVVDWEAGAHSGEPVRDLVRFALMYALYLDRARAPAGRRRRPRRAARGQLGRRRGVRARRHAAGSRTSSAGSSRRAGQAGSLARELARRGARRDRRGRRSHRRPRVRPPASRAVSTPRIAAAVTKGHAMTLPRPGSTAVEHELRSAQTLHVLAHVRSSCSVCSP